MISIVDIISIILIVGGLVFFFGASVGIFRFPDFYTRMHAAGKGDTLSSILILVGFAVHGLRDFSWADFSHSWPAIFVALKIIGISILIMLTSPTSTHALMEAGYDDRIEPWVKGKGKGAGKGEGKKGKNGKKMKSNQ